MSTRRERPVASSVSYQKAGRIDLMDISLDTNCRMIYEELPIRVPLMLHNPSEEPLNPPSMSFFLSLDHVTDQFSPQPKCLSSRNPEIIICRKWK
jgi:hypothetical protein